MYWFKIKTKICCIEVRYSGNGIFSLNLNGESKKTDNNYKVYRELKNDIIKYLKGEKVDFNGYKIDYCGYTEFEKIILKKARIIPYGKTITYFDLAKKCSLSPSHSRSVGNALGKNRVPIIIPCHRITKRDGRIGGFSAGEKWKRHLLTIEGINLK